MFLSAADGCNRFDNASFEFNRLSTIADTQLLQAAWHAGRIQFAAEFAFCWLCFEY